MQSAKIVILVSGIGLFLFGGLLGPLAYAEDSVGFIHVQRLLLETKMGKEAAKKFSKKNKQRARKVDAKVKKLNDFNAETEKVFPQLNSFEQKRKEEEFQKLYEDMMQEREKASQAITMQNQQLIEEVLKKAHPILLRLAKERGYSIVIKDPKAIGFVAPRVNITNEVVRELDKIYDETN